MRDIVFVVEKAPGGGFTARALGESIHTQAETLDQLRDEARDAVGVHLDESADMRIRLLLAR